MSHTFTIEHDTALAECALKSDGIPAGFKKDVFTTLVWDNNDFGEETLSGKGTTHNTNGIIIQKCDAASAGESVSAPTVHKRKQRSLSAPPVFIQEFNRSRHGPSG
jgi:hypothetical protein